MSESSSLASGKLPESGDNRGYVLGVVSASHLLNHVQMTVNAVLLPVMMRDMGFDFFQLGLIVSLHQLAGSAMQAVWGVLVQYYRRSTLLGAANIILGVFAVATGFTQTFTQVVAARVFAGVGSSAQNPLGASMLATYFRKAKGQILGIHQTAGNIGSVIAPLVIVALLSFLDWRQIWVVLAIPTVLMGFAYLFTGDAAVGMGVSRKRDFRTALRSYAICLKNREVMALAAIQMVGAAGRGSGFNMAYFVPFFQAWLGVGTDVAGILLAVQQLGAVVGPIGFGYLSDRTSRRWALFLVLFLSTVSTITLLLHSQVTAALVFNLLVYGAVVNSRQALTMSMVSDAVPVAHCDAAFSLYYFIGFISGPVWTALSGYLVDSRGFGVAFIVVGLTYLNGIALLALLGRSKKARVVGTA
ncbi:MAG: MFS transporter [Chloroflexi bacterium]|nr:MFS transporter [Chloroflexota bacterium]